MQLLEQQCKKMESLLKHESELREQEFRTSAKRERLLKRAREEIVILKEKIAFPVPDLDASMPIMQPDIKVGCVSNNHILLQYICYFILSSHFIISVMYLCIFSTYRILIITYVHTYTYILTSFRQ